MNRWIMIWAGLAVFAAQHRRVYLFARGHQVSDRAVAVLAHSFRLASAHREVSEIACRMRTRSHAASVI